MNEKVSLDQLKPGESGMIYQIHTIDKVKRRFLDLGMIPNTKIKVLYESPFRDPKAYLIRGSVIALRKEDTNKIEVLRMEESEWD